VALALGHTGGGIGVSIELDVDFGPVTLSGDLSVGLATPAAETSNLSPVVTVTLGAAVDPGVIQPGGVSIEPSIGLAVAAAACSCGSTDRQRGGFAGLPARHPARLRLRGRRRRHGRDALLELARRVLVPVAVETVLDTAEVTGWLNSDLGVV